MQCPFCASGLVAEWRGYVPIWDQDWSLRYVLIGEEIFESVDQLKIRDQVIVTRARDPKSPLIVRAGSPFDRELPLRSPFNQPIAMLRVCLTLWKMPALTNWFENHWPLAMGDTGGQAIPVSPPPAAKNTKASDTVEPVPLADLMRGSRLSKLVGKEKPSTNGDGKH